jgi:uncharacterized protein YdaU (DUF1376 family)
MKDPAFLFFPGDWLGGTQTLTRLHKGAYMDLLMAQFNNGHMALQDIQFILGEKDFNDLWPKLKTKFKIDFDGLLYNQKLENEIIKRKKFTDSRHNNLKSTKTHTDHHMGSQMENGDINGDINRNRDGDDYLGKSENPFNGAGLLIGQMHEVWKKSFPSYTDDIQHDYPACKSIADFIFKNANIINGYGNNNEEIKVLNTLQLIADQVNREPFWTNKPLKSIASNIQEFYNKIKNPNGTGRKSIDDDKLRQKLAERDPSRR